MQLNSQEIETFQNFPVALKRGLEKVAHVEWVLASVKRLTDKQMNPKLSRMSPGFFLTLVSLVVGLELNPFRSNLPCCQKLPRETPDTHPESRTQPGGWQYIVCACLAWSFGLTDASTIGLDGNAAVPGCMAAGLLFCCWSVPSKSAPSFQFSLNTLCFLLFCSLI